MTETGNNTVQLSGCLTMQTVPELFRKGLPLTKGKRDLVIDFAQIEAVDSSAVSLMLSWLRTAQRNNVKLSFVNVPDNLSSLANLYAVAELLSLPVEAKLYS